MHLQNGSNDDGLRIGRHSADGDTLVFDPAHSKAGSTNVELFSLTQFRKRAFPQRVVESRIEEIVDPAQRAEAEARYRDWAALKAERDRELVLAQESSVTRRHEHIVENHRRFVEGNGVEYKGVQDSSEKVTGGSRRRPKSSCSRCTTALDDFAGLRCVACMAVLCSCGACACAPARGTE
jgi:hypothetical protein